MKAEIRVENEKSHRSVATSLGLRQMVVCVIP